MARSVFDPTAFFFSADGRESLTESLPLITHDPSMSALHLLHKLRPSLTGGVAVLSLLLVTACQTNKGAQAPEPIGKDVQLTQLRQVVQTQVPDPNRSARLLSMVGSAERELGALNQDFNERSKEFGKMSADHSKTANDLQVFLRSWSASENTGRVRLTDTLLAMKNYATAEEWPAISDAFVNGVMNQSDRYQSLRPTSS